MSVAITCPPSRNMASAVARPMPWPAAVARQTLPRSRSIPFPPRRASPAARVLPETSRRGASGVKPIDGAPAAALGSAGHARASDAGDRPPTGAPAGRARDAGAGPGARLPIWSGPVDPQPLGGGITNVNFLVEDAGRRVVVRIGDDIPVHGVMRFNELAASRAAHAAGVSPAVLPRRARARW